VVRLMSVKRLFTSATQNYFVVHEVIVQTSQSEIVNYKHMHNAFNLGHDSQVWFIA